MAIPESAVWLITGCSTGFGRALAETLLRSQARVVVTARDRGSVRDFMEAHPEQALALALDVTDAGQVAAAVREAEQKFGAVDVLVNNAGYGYLAAIEEGDENDYRAMFEANLFGLIGMTQAVLPGMRKRGRGHVVNISSVGGLIGFPGSGFYAGTKFAVEGVSEALAQEVAPLGIGVTIVEPGPFRTDWAGRSLKQARTPIAAYAETAGARRREVSQYSGQQAGDPVRGAQAIIRAVHAAKLPLRLLLGAMAYDLAQKKLADMKQNFSTWEAASRGADFPRAAAAE